MGARRTIILLFLVVATTISCSLASQSEFGSCEPQERLGGWSEVAAERVWSCMSFIEVDGLSYQLGYDEYGCVEVDAPFLGKSIAFGEGAAARPIEGVPRHVALALTFPPDSESYPGCSGWHLWHGSGITRQEERFTIQEVTCRVVPSEKPDPKSCTEASASAAV